MTHDSTRDELAAIARAEFAAWKREPARRETRASSPRSRRAVRPPVRPPVSVPFAAVECGSGPADPAVLTELIDAVSPVRPLPLPVPSSRGTIEKLIARGTGEDRIASITGVSLREIRDVRARMDELSA